VSQSGPLHALVQELLRGLNGMPLPSSGGSSNCVDLFKTALNASTGIMLHRRFTNLPLELIAPLHSNLEEDVVWCIHSAERETDAAKIGIDGVARNDELMCFAAMSDILVINVCRLDGTTLADGNCCEIMGGNASLMFDAFEDEIYMQNAKASVLFKSKDSPNALLVALVPLAKFKKCTNEITTMCTA
jgi:hypothetical protein